MKKLFIILCDIMAVAAIIATVFLVWWAVAAALGWEAAGTMRSICAGSAVVSVIAAVASFIVWRNGGAPGGTRKREEGLEK